MDVTSGFMHKYYDWAAFELFVKSIYEAEGDVSVERDVTELDRYGAKRQIDVRITRRTRLHTFVTLAECKRWKDPVSRDRIDVLAASIEALGANNGAIFTTTGYEAGAIAYAKGKNIELFVVRDLTPEEWGAPGRHVSLYIHALAAEMGSIQFPGAMGIALLKEAVADLGMDITLSKDMLMDPTLNLYSTKTGLVGPNLIGIFADSHRLISQALSSSVGLLDGGRDMTFELVAACEIDFSKTEFRQLRLPKVALTFDRVTFHMKSHIYQSTFNFDRGADLDFAVMIESFVSDQQLIAHRRIGAHEVDFRLAGGDAIGNPINVLQNGTLIKTICAPWMGIEKVLADKQAVAEQILRVEVAIELGKPKLALQVVATPPGFAIALKSALGIKA